MLSYWIEGLPLAVMLWIGGGCLVLLWIGGCLVLLWIEGCLVLLWVEGLSYTVVMWIWALCCGFWGCLVLWIGGCLVLLCIDGLPCAVML